MFRKSTSARLLFAARLSVPQIESRSRARILLWGSARFCLPHSPCGGHSTRYSVQPGSKRRTSMEDASVSTGKRASQSSATSAHMPGRARYIRTTLVLPLDHEAPFWRPARSVGSFSHQKSPPPYHRPISCRSLIAAPDDNQQNAVEISALLASARARSGPGPPC